MPLPRLAPLLLASTLLVACAPLSHTAGTSTPRPAARSRPVQGTLRLQTHAGGVIDFSLPPGDSTVTLQVGPDSPAAPRARLRMSQAALRRFVALLDELASEELPNGMPRYTWGVEVEDPAHELALNVTRVAQRRDDLPPRDSFAIAARLPGAPLAMTLTEEEFRDVAGLARSYAAFLALMPATPPGSARPYYDFEVDEPVMPARGGCMPTYPEQLRRRGVTGEVRVEFVVAADGRVEEDSFRVLQASDPGFASAIRRSLGCFRYTPARVAGAPVRVVGTQLFAFDIARDY